jgi:hypothetical protein
MFWSHTLIGEIYDCGLRIMVINPAFLVLFNRNPDSSLGCRGSSSPYWFIIHVIQPVEKTDTRE